jgi:hypothetical protein
LTPTAARGSVPPMTPSTARRQDDNRDARALGA